jgi:hypothetical protein
LVALVGRGPRSLAGSGAPGRSPRIGRRPDPRPRLRLAPSGVLGLHGLGEQGLGEQGLGEQGQGQGQKHQRLWLWRDRRRGTRGRRRKGRGMEGPGRRGRCSGHRRKEGRDASFAAASRRAAHRPEAPAKRSRGGQGLRKWFGRYLRRRRTASFAHRTACEAARHSSRQQAGPGAAAVARCPALGSASGSAALADPGLWPRRRRAGPCSEFGLALEEPGCSPPPVWRARAVAEPGCSPPSRRARPQEEPGCSPQLRGRERTRTLEEPGCSPPPRRTRTHAACDKPPSRSPRGRAGRSLRRGQLGRR